MSEEVLETLDEVSEGPSRPETERESTSLSENKDEKPITPADDTLEEEAAEEPTEADKNAVTSEEVDAIAEEKEPIAEEKDRDSADEGAKEEAPQEVEETERADAEPGDAVTHGEAEATATEKDEETDETGKQEDATGDEENVVEESEERKDEALPDKEHDDSAQEIEDQKEDDKLEVQDEVIEQEEGKPETPTGVDHDGEIAKEEEHEKASPTPREDEEAVVTESRPESKMSERSHESKEDGELLGEAVSRTPSEVSQIFPPREELLETYKQAMVEREHLMQQNTKYQHKISEYFRKKKESDARSEAEGNIIDQEQRYLKYMSDIEENRNRAADISSNYTAKTENTKAYVYERVADTAKRLQDFLDMQLDIASKAVNSRTGRGIDDEDLDHYVSNFNKKEEELQGVRLENIKLNNRLMNRENQLKSREELATGLHLIDFEQLKIENQTYNEKIEERNEDLLKLRKKITATVEVLTHVKEKTDYMEIQNGELKENLMEVEATVAKRRDLLTRTKKVRDALRNDNSKMRETNGLLWNKSLLRDYEETFDRVESASKYVSDLMQKHADCTMRTQGYKRKIENVKHAIQLKHN